MQMHHELLQDALQEEEARAVVIEVEPDPSKEEEEFYAADFEEDYGQGHYYEDDKDEPDREETRPVRRTRHLVFASK
jgi:hypothetical protein